MSTYKENPKTKGSGVVCAIPQTGECPVKCDDCFFQSGRSFLEPLDKNLPNMPDVVDYVGRVVRVNDGNDSNNKRVDVVADTFHYRDKFFNTSIPKLDFPGPVVLTVNPGKMTDDLWHVVAPVPKNLMFVRYRTNTWNLDTCRDVVAHYSGHEVPVVLTFMAYHDVQSIVNLCDYAERKRTLNSYWAITTEAYLRVMDEFKLNKWVYSCGTEGVSSACSRCGNCLREYFATKERLR
jgi:hypothetical protein